MEVKLGYKMTDDGIFPEGWDQRRLSSLVMAGPSNGYSGRSSKDARGTPTLTLGATTSGTLILNDKTIKRLEETIDPNSDLFLQSGDVLVQRSNTLDLVGTTAVFDGPSGVYVYPDLMMRMRFRDDATAHWFWRYANSANGRRFFMTIAAGSSGSMPKISGTRLRRMTVAVPPLPEQRAIATALSDVDALLDGLNRLIAKKRDLKQAAMQQLLTGKTRLPGFLTEWEVKRVIELGEVVTGGTPRTGASSYWGDRYPWVTPTDISTRRDMSSSERCLTQDGLKTIRSLPPDSVLVTCIASIGKNAILRVAGACNQQINAVIPNRSSDPVFLYYLFEASKQYLLANAGTTATSIVSKTSFSGLAFRVPRLGEQIAIAGVLSDVDDELVALEARRSKTRDVKQAMMQELLTGKTRLVPVGDADA